MAVDHEMRTPGSKGAWIPEGRYIRSEGGAAVRSSLSGCVCAHSRGRPTRRGGPTETSWSSVRPSGAMNVSPDGSTVAVGSVGQPPRPVGSTSGLFITHRDPFGRTHRALDCSAAPAPLGGRRAGVPWRSTPSGRAVLGEDRGGEMRLSVDGPTIVLALAYKSSRRIVTRAMPSANRSRHGR